VTEKGQHVLKKDDAHKATANVWNHKLKNNKTVPKTKTD